MPTNQSRPDPPASALTYVAPQQVDFSATTLPELRQTDVLTRTSYSGISRGTERLVFHGLIPASEWDRMRVPGQTGDFGFPLTYGYAAVGVVEAGPRELVGRTVFCMHPHQDRFVADAARVVPVPDGVPPRRAVLAANMETALNAVWDAGAGPADRIAVVGGGLVGLLVTALCAGLPGAEVTLVDVEPSRGDIARLFGAGFAAPGGAREGADIVFHTSASEAGLATALGLAGDEATVVEMSWYGARQVAVPLGGRFHSGRLRLVSSQVGMVSPGRRPRWSHRRRVEAALRLLADPRFDALITEEVAFADLPQALPRILGEGAPGIATVVRYL